MFLLRYNFCTTEHTNLKRKAQHTRTCITRLTQHPDQGTANYRQDAASPTVRPASHSPKGPGPACQPSDNTSELQANGCSDVRCSASGVFCEHRVCRFVRAVVCRRDLFILTVVQYPMHERLSILHLKGKWVISKSWHHAECYERACVPHCPRRQERADGAVVGSGDTATHRPACLYSHAVITLKTSN